MPTTILTGAPPIEERRGYAVLYETPEAILSALPTISGPQRIGVVVDNKNEDIVLVLEASHASLADAPSAGHWYVPVSWVKAWIGPVSPPVKPPHIPFR